MAAATGEERGRGGSRWDSLIAFVVAPLLLWCVDLWQAVRSHTPLEGFTGSAGVVVDGILSTAGVYLAAFALVRGLLELPRWVAQEVCGSPVWLPRSVVGLLAVSLLLWLDL